MMATLYLAFTWSLVASALLAWLACLSHHNRASQTVQFAAAIIPAGGGITLLVLAQDEVHQWSAQLCIWSTGCCLLTDVGNIVI